MSRVVIFLYGLLAYACFFFTILYAIGFVGGIVVPKGIDDGTVGAVGPSILINVAFLLTFAVQHTIMARPAFKRWWTRIIPKAAERSTFVIVTSAILVTTFWQWRPLTGIVWDVETPALRAVLWGGFALGWGMVFYSTFLIDHFDLFGLRQVVLNLRRRPYAPTPFVERSLYRIVRNPLMLGFVIAFWTTPTMTTGHLLFAAVTTAYIIFGINVEERDIAKALGPEYESYRARTPMLIPIPKGLRSAKAAGRAA